MHIDKDLVAASATPLVLAILAEGESYGLPSLLTGNPVRNRVTMIEDGLVYLLPVAGFRALCGDKRSRKS